MEINIYCLQHARLIAYVILKVTAVLQGRYHYSFSRGENGVSEKMSNFT